MSAYRKLAAGNLSFSTARDSLWLGSDHLLVVRRLNYQESYRRLYLREIAAITLQRTRRRLWISLFFGTVLAGIAALIRWTAADADTSEASAMLVILSVFLGTPLLINLLKGPTCACTFHTAVAPLKIECLGRTRRAMRILRQLRPLIEQAQGAVPSQPPAPDVTAT